MQAHRFAGPCLTALLLLAAAPWAWADERLPSSPSPLQLTVQQLHGAYQATERQGVLVLNQDSGALAGAQLTLTAPTRWARLQLALQQLQGTVAYSGYTQQGLPLQTSTALHWQRTSLGVEPVHRWAVGTGNLGLVMGISQLRLQRAIEASTRSLPTTETLQLDLIQAAALWQQPLPWGCSLDMGLQWQHAHRSRLAVDSFGVLDRYVLVPQAGGWPSAHLALNWPLSARLALVANVQHEALRVRNAPALAVLSNGRPAAVSGYPGSRQRLQVVGLGLRGAF